MTAPTAALDVCSSGAEAVTVNDSWTVPTERLSVGREVSPVRSTTALSSVLLKPGELDFDVIGSRPEARHGEAPFAVGDDACAANPFPPASR